MKLALELVSAMELPADLVGALGAGIVSRESIAGLFELVAQRARKEALEMAAKVCEGERCKESCFHLACEALMLAANDIRGIPTTPGDGEVGR